jgi:membrane protein required for colicin V production
MNLVDLGVIGVIAVSALLGLSRGFVREMLGLGSWVIAGYGAFTFGPQLVPLANRAIGNPDIAGVAAYAGTFMVLVIVLSLLANLVGRMVRVSALGGLDRTFGTVFGIARGSAVMIAAYILSGLVLHQPWPPAIAQARTVPLLYHGAVWVAAVLPEQYRPAVLPPPDDRPTTSAELLHATPEGRALGPRPVRN